MIDTASRTIDLGVGQPDFPTPDHIKRAGQEAITDGYTKYTPQPGFLDLREAIAHKFNTENAIDLSPEQVVVSCGAKHSLYNVFQCALEPGDEVIILSPHWFAYTEQVRFAGGVPVLVPTDERDGFHPDLAAVRAAVTERSKAIVLNSPCNPTGAVLGADTLAALAELAMEHDLLIVADEVYETIVFDGRRHISIASLSPEVAARTVTVNSVSKTHAMTGWRIGYAGLPIALAERVTLLQSQSTSGPCAIAQRAALAALTGDQQHVRTMLDAYAGRRASVLERLNRIKALSCARPEGTFYVFADLSALIGKSIRSRVVTDSEAFAAILLEKAGVRVTPGTSFGADRHIRISFAASLEDLGEGMDRLENLTAS